MVTEGTIDGNKFYDFVRGDLIPCCQHFDGIAPQSIIIMDNLSVHHNNYILSLLQDSGIVVQFLPPYSPELNPVEEAFSYIKYFLKLHEDMLEANNNPISLIEAAIETISVEMCNQWITHSGY